MSENDQGQQFEQGAQPPATPPGEPTPPVAPTPPPVAAPVAANTSGTGGPVPEEIMGWNWGAFWWSWIWGIAHNVWIALLALCLWGIWNIVLGVKGSEWAWQHRQFDSIEQFKQTQAVWAKWGWILAAVLVVICILVALLGGLAIIGLGAYGGLSS